MNSRDLLRPFLILGLIVATLGFGLASLCGAVFTAWGLPHAIRLLLSGHAAQVFSGEFLQITVPSLVIGGAGAWWCGRLLWRWMQP